MIDADVNADFASVIAAVRDRLSRNLRIRRNLPGDGRLRIDRQLPFLCVYRTPPEGRDNGTRELVTTEAAYLVASGEPAYEAGLDQLCGSISETLEEHFGALLLLELWAEDDRTPPAATRELARPHFRIVAPQDDVAGQHHRGAGVGPRGHSPARHSGRDGSDVRPAPRPGRPPSARRGLLAWQMLPDRRRRAAGLPRLEHRRPVSVGAAVAPPAVGGGAAEGDFCLRRHAQGRVAAALRVARPLGDGQGRPARRPAVVRGLAVVRLPAAGHAGQRRRRVGRVRRRRLPHGAAIPLPPAAVPSRACSNGSCTRSRSSASKTRRWRTCSNRSRTSSTSSSTRSSTSTRRRSTTTACNSTAGPTTRWCNWPRRFSAAAIRAIVTAMRATATSCRRAHRPGGSRANRLLPRAAARLPRQGADRQHDRLGADGRARPAVTFPTRPPFANSGSSRCCITRSAPTCSRTSMAGSSRCGSCTPGSPGTKRCRKGWPCCRSILPAGSPPGGCALLAGRVLAVRSLVDGASLVDTFHLLHDGRHLARRRRS